MAGMDCTAPAVWRIEIYPDRKSPAMEGVTYSCADHLSVDRAAVIATGAVPYVIPALPADAGRTCGETVAYIAGEHLAEAS